MIFVQRNVKYYYSFLCLKFNKVYQFTYDIKEMKQDKCLKNYFNVHIKFCVGVGSIRVRLLASKMEDVYRTISFFFTPFPTLFHYPFLLKTLRNNKVCIDRRVKLLLLCARVLGNAQSQQILTLHRARICEGRNQELDEDQQLISVIT